MKNILRFLLPLLMLSGCAYRNMLFNNLDWLAVYQMDSYLDLTPTQEKQIKMPVHETVNWLKAERLPAIQKLLLEVQTAAEARRVNGKQYDAWVLQMETWRSEVTERMTPPMALLLKNLNEDQLQHLTNKLEKSDRDLVKLLERSEKEFSEALSDYVDDAAANYKYWFGKLRKDQKQILAQKLGWTRSYLSEQLKQKRRSREFWLDILRKRDTDAIVSALRKSSTPEGSWNDPEYRAFRKDARVRFRDFLLSLFVSLDQDQWQHFEKVMRELGADVETLAKAERGKT